MILDHGVEVHQIDNWTKGTKGWNQNLEDQYSLRNQEKLLKVGVSLERYITTSSKKEGAVNHILKRESIIILKRTTSILKESISFKTEVNHFKICQSVSQSTKFGVNYILREQLFILENVSRIIISKS